jgi:hypothetical protein
VEGRRLLLLKSEVLSKDLEAGIPVKEERADEVVEEGENDMEEKELRLRLPTAPGEVYASEEEEEV